MVSFFLSTGSKYVLDVSAFSHLLPFNSYKCDTSYESIFVSIDHDTFDLTDALTPYIPREDTRSSELLIISVGGGKTLILDYLYIKSPIQSAGDDELECRIGRYLCW